MSQNITVSRSHKKVKATIQLTGSKSECNRALVIEALSKGKVKVTNISDAADAVTLAGILRKEEGEQITIESVSLSWTKDSDVTKHVSSITANSVDIGPAGTAMRFLTAYLALQPGNSLLTGT